MKPKTIKILYWTLTVLFGLAMLADGIAGFYATEQGTEAMKTLGYPMYLSFILGAAKILGALAILQNRFHTLKEWAFAGFAIDFIGASASWAFVSGPFLFIATPWIFLIFMFVVYFFWKKELKITNIPLPIKK